MEFDVLFFASYRDLVGRESVTVSLPGTATVQELVRAVRGRGGVYAELPERPAVAVNHVVVPHDEALSPGDEVAFLPPVAGG